MKRKVLVLGHDSQSFLSVIRSLGRAGIEVHVAWHQPDSVGRYALVMSLGRSRHSFLPGWRTTSGRRE